MKLGNVAVLSKRQLNAARRRVYRNYPNVDYTTIRSSILRVERGSVVFTLPGFKVMMKGGM
jgi:hypothetical protein